MNKVSILIADDHELVRDGIKARLEKHPGWTVCGEAANGRGAVELAAKLKPDVAILDIGMSELNGIEAARQILRIKPSTEILILTMQESEELAREALSAGVHGFLLKTDAGRLLVLAIESLLQHKPYFTSQVFNLVMTGYLDTDRTESPIHESRTRLTAREREIIQLLAESKTSKETASCLGVSVKTVEAHRANIMRKLNLHSVAELVRYAIRHKIIEA